MFGAKNRARLARLDLLAQACDDSQASFGEELECLITVRLMDRAGGIKWEESWSSQRTPPEGGWDWPLISEASKSKADEFCIAIWHDTTILCGVFHLLVRGNSIQLLAVEGNPDENHPLKGSVSAIGVDVAERFADLLGRSEIWLVEPVDGLLDLYVNGLGFEFHENEGGRRICKRRV
jgi:hypothetical protein